ncbi:MAG: ABC-2 transporter permease [Gemmatimonadaceae bacterium]|nr:ABC-2 transporter permease [Gemmatimonadaceae bacterium]
MLTLMGLDLRNGWRNLMMAAVMVTVGCALVFVHRDASRWGPMLASTGALMFAAGPAAVSFRDRFEGTLWLVATLPVSPRMIAAARFIEAAILSIPAAIVSVILVASTDSGATLGLHGLANVGIISWITLTFGAILVLVATLAVPPTRLHLVLFGALAGMAGLGWLIDQFTDDPVAVLVELAGTPLGLLWTFVTVAAACTLSLFAGFFLIARAIERFEQPDTVRAALTRGRWTE